jgi:hypothetical protein
MQFHTFNRAHPIIVLTESRPYFPGSFRKGQYVPWCPIAILLLPTLDRTEPLPVSSRPPLPAPGLILGDFADALRLLVAHLDRRDLVAVGNAARDLLASGLYFH